MLLYYIKFVRYTKSAVDFFLYSALNCITLEFPLTFQLLYKVLSRKHTARSWNSQNIIL